MENIHTDKRKAVNVTISESVLRQAKALSLNTSRAAEAGLTLAIKVAQEAQWREENTTAINAHNKRVEENGTILTPHWLD